MWALDFLHATIPWARWFLVRKKYWSTGWVYACHQYKRNQYKRFLDGTRVWNQYKCFLDGTHVSNFTVSALYPTQRKLQRFTKVKHYMNVWTVSALRSKRTSVKYNYRTTDRQANSVLYLQRQLTPSDKAGLKVLLIAGNLNSCITSIFLLQLSEYS